MSDAEQSIHQYLQVVARGVVAVQIQAARVFQDAVHLCEAHRHISQIRAHPVTVLFTRSVDGVICALVGNLQFSLEFGVPIVQASMCP